MEITYERGINGTRMLLPARASACAAYVRPMILGNRIRGFIKAEFGWREDGRYYEYTVSSLMSLSEYLEHHMLSQQMLKQWVFDLWQAVNELEEYLLTEEYVVLTPELIFLQGAGTEPFQGTFLFCLYPDGKQGMKDSLKEVLKYLMGKTDPGEEAAAVLCYELYGALQKENFCLREFMEVLERQVRLESPALVEKKKHPKQLFASRRNSGIIKPTSR